MFFGNLTGKDSPIKGSYCFTKKDSDKRVMADLPTDRQCLSGGSLFDGSGIEFGWLNILDLGFDIDFSLEEKVFIDRIKIYQGKDSAVKSIKFLVKEGEKNRIKGRYDSQRGKLITDTVIDVPVGTYAKDFLLRVESDFHDIFIEKLEIKGAIFGENPVYPFPGSFEGKGDKRMAIDGLKKICCPEEALFPAQMLKGELKERFGIKTDIEIGINNSDGEGVIFIEDGLGEEEGYVLTCEDGRISIKGGDLKGMIYGAQTLLNLAVSGYIPQCSISDKPFKKFRGAHFGLPPREEIDFFKRLIKYVLVPMRYNTIFLEVAGGMRFDSHPKINEMWEKGNILAQEGKWPPFPHGTMVSGGKILEKDEVRDIIDYAQSFGIEVIPEIQSFGHVQYITIAYPEVGETEFIEEKNDYDLEVEDIPPSKFYLDSYCPSNEKSYEIMYDLMDEIIDVFKPREYVHMGHDEVYTIGTCPLCKGKDPAQLYYSDIMKLYNHLKGKNLKMMIWGDMLHEVTRYLTPPAIKKIPKDIVMLDFIWYFHLDRDLEDHLLDHDFEVIMGNMYSSHYPRYEKRIRKEGMLGAQVSTWVRPDEYTLGFEGKIYDFIYSANMMWSPDYDSDLRMSYDQLFVSMMPHIRNVLHTGTYPPLETPQRQSLEIDEDLFEGVECTEYRAVPVVYGRDKVKINVGDKYRSFIFSHASKYTGRRITWEEPHCIGKYTVVYKDGSQSVIDVEYGANIGYLNGRFAKPLEHPYYRHQGYISTYFSDPVMDKDLNGNDLTIYAYEWINPHSHKEIDHILAESHKDADTSYYVFKIEGVR